MDTPDQYRNLIEKILTEYASIPFAHGELHSKTVFDRQQDSYLLLDVGWNQGNRVHGTLVHVDIVDGKFWIQYDGTEDGIATELVHAGVPKEHIVLAWRPPERRKHTEFAVA